VIARVWHGFTLSSNAGKHAAYLEKELLPAYLGLPGNHGTLLVARSETGCTEFLVTSLWTRGLRSRLCGSSSSMRLHPRLHQTSWFNAVLMVGFDCLFFIGLERVSPRPFDTAAESCCHRLVTGSDAGLRLRRKQFEKLRKPPRSRSSIGVHKLWVKT
jgi:hypothetical protein